MSRFFSICLIFLISTAINASPTLQKHDSVTYHSIRIDSSEGGDSGNSGTWTAIHVTLTGVKVLGQRYLNGSVNYSYVSNYQGTKAQLGLRFYDSKSRASTISKYHSAGGYRKERATQSYLQHIGNAKFGKSSNMKQFMSAVKRHSEQDYVLLHWALINSNDIIKYAIDKKMLSNRAASGYKRTGEFVKAAYGDVYKNKKVVAEADTMSEAFLLRDKNERLELKNQKLVSQIAGLSKQIKKLRKDVKDANDERSKYEKTILDTESIMSSNQEKLVDLSEKLNIVQQEKNNLEKQISKEAQERLNEIENEHKQKISKYQAIISSNEAELTKVRAELKSRTSEVKNLNAELSSLKQANSNMKKGSSEEVQEKNKIVDGLYREIARLEKKVQNAEGDIRIQLTKATNENLALKNQISELKAEQRVQLNIRDKVVARQEQNISELESTINAITEKENKKHAALKQELANVQEKLKQKTTHLEAITSILNGGSSPNVQETTPIKEFKSTGPEPSLIKRNYERRSSAVNEQNAQNWFLAQDTDIRKGIQIVLKSAGYYSSSIDGKWGKGTEQAIHQYNSSLSNGQNSEPFRDNLITSAQEALKAQSKQSDQLNFSMTCPTPQGVQTFEVIGNSFRNGNKGVFPIDNEAIVKDEHNVYFVIIKDVMALNFDFKDRNMYQFYGDSRELMAECD